MAHEIPGFLLGLQDAFWIQGPAMTGIVTVRGRAGKLVPLVNRWQAAGVRDGCPWASPHLQYTLHLESAAVFLGQVCALEHGGCRVRITMAPVLGRHQQSLAMKGIKLVHETLNRLAMLSGQELGLSLTQPLGYITTVVER